MVHIHDGILLGHKKEQNNVICSNMDGTRDSHPEWSKSERERQIPYDITYLESNTWHKWRQYNTVFYHFYCTYITYIWNLIYDTKETHGLGE